MTNFYDYVDLAAVRRRSVQKARALGAEAGYNGTGIRENPYLLKYQADEYRDWIYMYRKTEAYRKVEKRSRRKEK